MSQICFGKNLCMDKTLLLIIILVAIGILFYDHYQVKKQVNKQINNNIKDQIVEISTPTPIPPPIPPPIPTPIPPVVGTIGQIIKNYDYRALEDPLTPPFKRDDYMIPAQMVRPDVFGIYTSGAPGIFRKMGYLKSTSEENQYKFLNLIGRPKYNGSTIYEYYVTSTNRDENIKFYLNKNKKELYDGDRVKVPQLDGNYEVIIDKNLDLEYIPFV